MIVGDIFSALTRHGVLGINRRNTSYTLRCNPRRLYPLVDDKLKTKQLCLDAGIPIPGLIAKAGHHFEIPDMLAKLSGREDFVLKPARGAMGNGILVIRAREGDEFVKAGGHRIDASALRYHAASIISGLYSLGGDADQAVIEERLVVHPALQAISSDGAPDIRIVVYRGVPVMSMTRLPTTSSGGRANLHQGAVGAGINLADGRIVHAVIGNRPIERHPDTQEPIVGVTLPDFSTALNIAVRASDQTGLGYVGADVVIDAQRGPVILELNARPGLAIQLANRVGLLPRLRAVESMADTGMSVEDRIAFGARIAEQNA